MIEVDPEKLAAARAAALLVEPGMSVGLGSGSTAALFVHELATRIRQEALSVVGVATSRETARLAASLGIRLVELDEITLLDIDVDGADEVDPEFRMIKGRGGALLHEKIVATAASRRVIMVGPGKLVDRLGAGRMPIPVEVSSFGLKHTLHGLRNLGATTAVRLGSDGTLFRTDEDNRIVDCHFAEIDDPTALDRRLRTVVGVFETGIFVNLCDTLLIGRGDQAERRDRPRR